MPIDLDTLNTNQRTAVLWNDGPMLVLAGPGSGKTRVLTLRVVRLLEEREDVSVLALTFTDKAAAEMRTRVDQLLGQRGGRAHLCTFHSFATDVLRQHGSHLGIQPDFSLLTQDEDRIAMLDGVANALATDGHPVTSDRKNLLGLVDRLFSESYDGGPVAPSLVHTPEWVPLLFAGYCAALVAANRLDFGSLLGLTHRLLREKPGVARVLRLGWTHVCVDEFQDTNRAQYELLKLVVAEEQPNLFVVGDDDQIIYQWNGASPERLQAIIRDYGMEVVQLPENFRCPPEIVDLANKLIVHNRFRTPDKKPLTAFRPASLGDAVIRYGAFSSAEDEVAMLARDIEKRGLVPIDCVVLARATKMLEQAAAALRAAGLEAYVAKRKADFDVPIARVMLNALRLANARHDRDVLRRLCVSWEALAERALEVEDIAASAALVGGDFLRAWTESAAVGIDGEVAALLLRIRTSLVDRLDFPGVVDWFLAAGWKLWADALDRQANEEIETWRELHGDIVREHGHDDLTLNVYLRKMDLAPKTARPGPKAVRCMTVHGAKGLEFKHVYVIGMAQEVFPSFQALRKGPASRELEEERRNCFVAITRVQESLTLTRARQYGGWSKAASQFIAEMGLQEQG
jgi:DNA helicase-2/ATP-dependent DNA helicase PcrA